MTLKDRINQDFLVAFKNKEMDKKNFLGLIKGEIQNNPIWIVGGILLVFLAALGINRIESYLKK